MMIGTYTLLADRNLLKALVGLYVFQTGIILFFIMVAFRRGGTLPIVPYYAAEDKAAELINPLPHALMLTAIVVGVATLGVGLSILSRMQGEAATIEDRTKDED
jgi:multicomponent Na+:H+ antiporter subunit C